MSLSKGWGCVPGPGADVEVINHRGQWPGEVVGDEGELCGSREILGGQRRGYVVKLRGQSSVEAIRSDKQLSEPAQLVADRWQGAAEVIERYVEFEQLMEVREQPR